MSQTPINSIIIYNILGGDNLNKKIGYRDLINGNFSSHELQEIGWPMDEIELLFMFSFSVNKKMSLRETTTTDASKTHKEKEEFKLELFGTVNRKF